MLSMYNLLLLFEIFNIFSIIWRKGYNYGCFNCFVYVVLVFDYEGRGLDVYVNVLLEV